MDWQTLNGEQFLLTDFALLILGKNSPTATDRGNFKFTWLDSPTPKNPGVRNYAVTRILDSISLYFFNEEVAKAEILASANLALEFLTTVVDDGFSKKIHATKLEPKALLHGRHCQITQGKLKTAIEQVEWHYVNVYVPKELEMYLTIDANDCFPRLFLDKDNVLSEIHEWLAVRKEIANFSQWIDL